MQDVSAEDVKALAESSSDAWRTVLEHAITHGGEAAPAAFVRALLDADDDIDAWLRRAKNCAAIIDSERFSTIAQAMRPFRAWLLAGIAALPGAGDRATRTARFASLRSDTSEGALAATRAFVSELDDAVPEALRVEALLLLSRRALARGLGPEAEAAAARAETLLGPTRGADTRTARRLRGAACIRDGRFADGFAWLDAVMDVPGPALAGADGPRAIADPREAALDELAFLATWVTRSAPEWVRALGEAAETHAGTEHAAALAARFDDALSHLARSGDVAKVQTDLETVARQAAERGASATVEAAERWLPLRAIAPRGLEGGRLILRLRDARGAWLRVHDDGALEIARGDPRRDDSRTALRRLSADDLLRADSLALAGALHRDLVPMDLTRASPWPHAYPVQAFGGAPRAFVEGYVGIEHDMGRATDVFGIRDASDARAAAQTLRALLSLVP